MMISDTHDFMIDEMGFEELVELAAFYRERNMKQKSKNSARIRPDIESEIIFLKEHIKEMTQYLSGSNRETREFIFYSIAESIAEIEKMTRRLNTNSHNTGISREKIEQARSYPIENLIEVKRGIAKCVNHEDRHPSMDCRDNFAFCYGCHWSGDVIAVYMKLNSCDFNRAVRELTF